MLSRNSRCQHGIHGNSWIPSISELNHTMRWYNSFSRVAGGADMESSTRLGAGPMKGRGKSSYPAHAFQRDVLLTFIERPVFTKI